MPVAAPKPVQQNSVHVYDVTIFPKIEEDGSEDPTVQQIKEHFNLLCKKWCFQREITPTTQKVHYQGRVSLKNKTRGDKATKKQFFDDTNTSRWKCQFTVTSGNSKNDDFYVTKTESRAPGSGSGPWKNTDRDEYVPIQFRMLESGQLRPFQQSIEDKKNELDFRNVNIVYDATGNHGKSTYTAYKACKGEAIDLPPCNDGDKLVAGLCDLCYTRKLRHPGVVFIDLPRAMDQKKLGSMFTAIETIKKGYLYDFRYSFKEYWIDSPQLWVFCNFMPPTKYLSTDRWITWTINDANELVSMSKKDIAKVFLKQKGRTQGVATPTRAEVREAQQLANSVIDVYDSDDEEVADTELQMSDMDHDSEPEDGISLGEADTEDETEEN